MAFGKRYRKKPVVIHAICFASPQDYADICSFVSASLVSEYTNKPNMQLVIPTLEGEMRASLGDWIIEGVNGEFYPCKPDIFAKTYEAVSE